MSTEPASAGPPLFAGNEAEAAARFAETRGKDPYPNIHPALLNTADLLDYIAATGMIYPFEEPADRSEMLKPASCGIRLAGDVVYWDTEPDGTPKKVEETLKPGGELILKRNSIVYVTLEPTLRLPDYIAARFNLTIRDIYRGVLVGTGPLVDPGFTGRLSLPLHNLTYNDYPIRGGEPLVWMEFTKISNNEKWQNHGPSHARVSSYEEFPKRKKNRSKVHDYLRYAWPTPITSSIPPLVQTAQHAAVSAREAVRRQQRIFAGLSAFGAAILVVAIAAMLVAVVGVIQDSNSDRQALTEKVRSLSSRVHRLEEHHQAIGQEKSDRRSARTR